jgi:hypothetical protein
MLGESRGGPPYTLTITDLRVYQQNPASVFCVLEGIRYRQELHQLQLRPRQQGSRIGLMRFYNSLGHVIGATLHDC